jgi:hypothetical protein
MIVRTDWMGLDCQYDTDSGVTYPPECNHQSPPCEACRRTGNIRDQTLPGGDDD